MQDDTAVSEIVGSLILVLVVIVSATSFATFLQQKQRETQEQKLLENERQLETLLVSKLSPELHLTLGDRWDNLTFTIMSVHENPSRILDVDLNGHRVQELNLTRFNRTTEAWETDPARPEDRLLLAPRERIDFRLALDEDFFDTFSVLLTDPIQFRVVTDRLNTFDASFLPPLALALLNVESLWNGTAFTNTVLLDASHSAPGGEPARLVRWDWTVTNTVTAAETTYSGRMARAWECDGDARDIKLTVTDSFGLVATDEITGYEC